LAGDEEAFETIVRLYSRRIYVIAYGITQDVAEAEDVVQDTFLKAHQQRRQLRDADKFLPWLDTVARNGARDRLRKRRPQASAETFDALVDHGAERPGASLEQGERSARLRHALGALPEEHRTALSLLYLEGCDYRTIEARMGISNGALRGILGRALGTLRRNAGLLALERKTT
jgi:RNA polymerase sigma-70 factor (ECF subfamily)